MKQINFMKIMPMSCAKAVQLRTDIGYQCRGARACEPSRTPQHGVMALRGSTPISAVILVTSEDRHAR